MSGACAEGLRAESVEGRGSQGLGGSRGLGVVTLAGLDCCVLPREGGQPGELRFPPSSFPLPPKKPKVAK